MKKKINYAEIKIKVIKYLKSRINFDAEKINYWLDKLNPDFLSEEVSY